MKMMMNKMNLHEQFQTLAACIEIVHHIPGRIRLRLAVDESFASDIPLQSLLGQVSDFKKALNGVPAIRSVRVNALARSCTVEYDPQAVPAQAWVDFIHGVHSPAADVLRQTIAEKYAEVAGG